jgi:hypothetical protein
MQETADKTLDCKYTPRTRHMIENSAAPEIPNWVSKRQKKQENCPHENMLKDAFSEMTGVRRIAPGNVSCADCGEPLPLWWNRERPIPVSEFVADAGESIEYPFRDF